ncbi:MAG: hypothetical protein ACT6FC_05420, partial [Methanosarcinaceae archaeon]
MPKINHKNIGAIQKTAYLTAAIASVDSENDTACITGIGQCPSASEIPIFYHCSHDAVLRDNGALEGGSGAFAEDDEVIVQCEILDSTTYKPLYVIGFVDKPKRCEYEFYVRPTFNGFSPTYGGERLKLENDEISEYGVTVVTGVFAGLCGPFTQAVDTGEEHIFLNHIVVEGINPNYSGVNDLFAHFVEVPEIEASLHLGYLFNTLDWFDANKKTFEAGDSVGTPILHVNRVLELRNGSILSDCAKTVETINDIKYTVYSVNFTNLCFPASIHTEKKYLSTYACAGCGAIEENYESPIRYKLMVQSVEAYSVNFGNICEGYEAECAEELSGCKMWFVRAIPSHTPEVSITKDQLCILSDEYGNNPSYIPITISSNLYIHEQTI